MQCVIISIDIIGISNCRCLPIIKFNSKKVNCKYKAVKISFCVFE